MYQYVYEKVYCEASGIGITEYHTKNYKKIIEKRSSQGWKYIGYIPVVQRGNGYVEVIELIFEKQINE